MSLATRALTIASLGSAVVAGSLLHPVVSGQVNHTTHMGGPIGEGLVPTAGVFVALALALGLIAYRDHIPSVDRLVSSRTTKRVATVAVVGLVVTTAALSGMGGPASPVETVQAGYFDNCSFDDSLTFAIGASLGLSDQDCAFWTPDTEQVDATDAYAGGLAINDSVDSYLTTSENFQQDSRSVAWAKAKIKVINALNNNKSEAEALNESQAVVEDYYLRQEKNLYTQHSAQMAHIAYLANQSSGTLWVNKGADPTGIKQNVTGEYTYDATSLVNSSVTIENNTGIIFYDSYPGDNQLTVSLRPSQVVNPTLEQYSSTSYLIGVNDTDASSRGILWGSRYHVRSDAIADQNNQVQSNLETYVNETYQAYEAGEINATDLASSDPTTIATQASTDYDSTGYYGLASAQLAAMGLSGNETVSHVVNTTENGSARQITGTLFYTGEDSQAFDTGTEYDPATLNGSVYMSVASIEDGTGTELNQSGGFYHVTENFTISSATNTQTGEAVNTTTMETRDYSTTNASLLAEEIDRLKEQRAFYEKQQSAAGGGISLDFGGVETGVIIALLAVAFLATRD